MRRVGIVHRHMQGTPETHLLDAGDDGTVTVALGQEDTDTLVSFSLFADGKISVTVVTNDELVAEPVQLGRILADGAVIIGPVDVVALPTNTNVRKFPTQEG